MPTKKTNKPASMPDKSQNNERQDDTEKSLPNGHDKVPDRSGNPFVVPIKVPFAINGPTRKREEPDND